jgi:hypothetical protein
MIYVCVYGLDRTGQELSGVKWSEVDKVCTTVMHARRSTEAWLQG